MLSSTGYVNRTAPRTDGHTSQRLWERLITLPETEPIAYRHQNSGDYDEHLLLRPEHAPGHEGIGIHYARPVADEACEHTGGPSEADRQGPWNRRGVVIKLGMSSFWIGDRIRLRGIEPDDWPAFMRFAHDEEGLGDLLNPPRSAESYRAWAKEQAAATSDGDCFRLVIEAVATGETVGAIGSHHADPRAGWFEYGVTIGADHRRQGYAAEAVVMLLRFMFADRRYHKCQARVFAHNEASLTLQRRLGFIEEGRLRDLVFVAGEYHDLVMMGMLADEFAQLHSMSER